MRGRLLPYYFKARQALIAFFFYLPSWALRNWFGVRIAVLRTHRVGHMCLDFDAFIKERTLLKEENSASASRLYGVIADRSVNPALEGYWRSSFPDVFLSGPRAYVGKLLSMAGPCNHPILYGTGISAKEVQNGKDFREPRKLGPSTYQIRQNWGDRGGLIQLSDEHLEKGRKVLRDWGIPEGDWFVGMHVREAGWDQLVDGDAKAAANTFRNSDTNTYRAAVEAIAEAGGWVVRLGDPSMSKLEGEWPQMIDYARSEQRSDWMDLFLCSEARFFLGTNSGVFGMATLFGTPCAQCNQIPLTSRPYGRNDLAIFKRIRPQNQDQLISFHEILTTKYHLATSGYLYDLWNLEIVNNSPEEIRELAEEMMARLDGSFEESETDRELQRRIDELIDERHMCHPVISKIATTFLRRHQNLTLPS